LKLLREDDPLYPVEAQQVSAATWMVLNMLRDEVEDKRNMGNTLLYFTLFAQLFLIQGLSFDQKAAVTEFWRAQNILIVTSEPLFEGMGDPSKINSPKISRSQLTCEYFLSTLVVHLFLFLTLNFCPYIAKSAMLSLLSNPGSYPLTCRYISFSTYSFRFETGNLTDVRL
jgi:hypothetical protein